MSKLLLVPSSTFNRLYIPHATAEERYQLFYGGAGSGKSAFVASRIVVDCFIGRNTLVTRQVASRIANSCYNEILKAINRFGAGKFFSTKGGEINCLYSGSQILFSGLDDVEKLKSITPKKGVLTDIWIEEATETTYMSFNQLDKRLRGISPHKKRITLSFNPTDKNHWLYTHFFKGRDINIPLHRDRDILMLHSTYKDNAFLSQDDSLSLENENDEYMYTVYTKGMWEEQRGRVLQNIIIENLAGLEINKSTLRCGLDFGFTRDPSFAILLSYDESTKRIYIIDELKLYGHTNDMLAQKLSIFAKGCMVYCDSAEPKSIAEIRRMGIRAKGVKKHRDAIRHSIQWLMQHTIIVDEKLSEIQKELSSWVYNADGCTKASAGDHGIDAMRYALSNDMQYRHAFISG
ncbi:MAG: PBSX family phage terminase large subunit [Christensenellales bacterium]|jgi:phage terminase large subunit